MNDSNAIGRFILVMITLVTSVIISVLMVTNPTGGLAVLVQVCTVILTLVALISPRSGLFVLVPVVIWIDEIKRLAVYYGGTYSSTVVTALAMPLIILCGINLGFLLSVLFARVKVERVGWLLYLLAPTIGGAVFFASEGSFADRGQRAANISLYMSLIPIGAVYFKGIDDWRKFYMMQAIIALPAAAWAIKQYYFGFDHIEWTYAKSGLSKVHYVQMVFADNPRVFGLFGSASALGCASIYAAFSWWCGFRYRRWRWFWILIAAAYTYVLVCSTQRTSLIYPLIVAIFCFVFRSRLKTALVYAFVLGVFVVGVLSSTYMLNEGLEKINIKLSSINKNYFGDSEWGRRVLIVSTFSDRLRGWERLNHAKSWSLTGTDKAKRGAGSIIGYEDDEYNHDIINKILISYGVIGLLVVALPAVFVIIVLHRVVYSAPNNELRNDAAFVLALGLPIIGLAFVGGDNFSANPINLQIWSALGGLFVCRKYFKSVHMLSLKQTAEDFKLLDERAVGTMSNK